ncbi:hypothetical protein QL093DRAFT_2032169 [Fusarium oxysporum]|nr:hypothetical protein QL093DRAFT_2050604 [Fusarium oxysporum]KAJ9414783.1 hypothetical protein QL093DRAFT_2045911 [Fusarium oxysporum]KAJ9424357.1 hypothetical protein QL093DRAFT_2032169 [Fusarium oxysporum]
MASNPNTPAYFVVSGKVTKVDGSIQQDVEARAFDVDLRNEQCLGMTKISPKDGSYEIKYKADQFSRAEKRTADLKVYAYKWFSSSGSSSEPSYRPGSPKPSPPKHTAAQLSASAIPLSEGQPLAMSEIHFNASEKEIINLVIGGAVVVGPSEFKRLVAAITPLLERTKLGIADLVEDDKSRDISFGLHDDLNTLAGDSAESLEKALQTAIDENLIDTMDANTFAAAISSLRACGAQLAIKTPPDSSGSSVPTPLGALLTATLPKPSSFIAELSKFDGNTESFWNSVRENPDLKDKAGNLQFNVQVGIATMTHMPLVQELTRRQAAGQIKDFSDLVKYKQSDWLQLVKQSNIGVPSSVPGDGAELQANNYAKGMVNLLEDTFPTKFISRRLADPDDDEVHSVLDGKAQIQTFLQKNPKFEMTTMRLADFVAANPDSLKGIDNPDLLKLQLSKVQRIYAIAPRYTQMRTLLANDVTSAMQISRMGRNMFLNSFSSRFDSMSDAIGVFEKARQNHAAAINLWTNFSSKWRVPKLPNWLPWWIDTAPAQKAIPDWETLFGSVDSCSCDDCSSMTGPTAYYVDILHFLQNRLLIDDTKTIRDKNGKITSVIWQQYMKPNEERAFKNAKDILFERRADLGMIQLTCENMKTPVPYIDLTLEILENYISPVQGFAPFDLPVSAARALDNQDLATLAPLLQPHLPVPLSDHAVVNVLVTGHSWAIDEPAYTYFFDNINNTIHAGSRSRQTRGPPAELAANPQYVNANAYDQVSKEVYPLDLPFDLWMETVRTYLAHVDVRRYEIMETFSTADRLTASETNIILGVSGSSGAPFTDYWRLFGFAKKNLDASTSIPDPANKFHMIQTGDWFSVVTGRVDVFLQQTRITYSELLNCLEIGFVLDSESRLNIVAVEGAPVDTCTLSQLRLAEAGDGSLFNLIRMIRLQRKLDGWSLIDVARAMGSKLLPSDTDSFRKILLRISCIKRISDGLGIPVDQILAFWQPLERSSYRDHVVDDDDLPAPGSQYERIFRNKTISTRGDFILPKDPSKLAGTLRENLPIISASLNISTSDMNLLLKDPNIVPDDNLNLDNLSSLFRHVTLMQALDLIAKDYITILQLMAVKPFESPQATVAIIERVQRLGNSPFSLAQVDYILRNRTRPDEDIRMPDDTLVIILADIRSNLQQVAIDQTYSDDIDDKKGDITKKKLSLLNWDATVVATAIGIITNSQSYETALEQPLPSNLIFPDSLGEALSYNEDTLRLTFSRIMSEDEKTTLKGLANATPDFINAVDRLSLMPSLFFTRNLRTYSVPLFSVPLTSIPAGVSIPTALSKKVYWDSATTKLYSVGALHDAERQALIAGVSDTAYKQIIQDLYDAPLNWSPANGDAFLDDSDISFIVDTTNGASTSQRFLRVLKKLLPYLLESLSNQAIQQKLGQAMGLTIRLIDPLLSHYLHISAMTLNDLFRDPSYAASNKLIPVTPTRFPAQFQALRLLEKVVMIVAGFKLGVDELNWLFTFRSQTNDPAAAWLNIEQLPLEFSDQFVPDFPGWERLVAVIRVRDSFPNGKDILNFMWTASRSTQTAKPEFLTSLAGLTLWDVEALKALDGPTGLNFTFPRAYQDETALLKIAAALSLVRKIGSTVSDAILLAGSSVTQTAARAVRQAVKSKYDQDTWNTVARPLQNILREKQRAALVSYTLTHPDRSQRKTWHTPADISAFFLIDVEQGPCAFSSRIKQAIGSVQTFVQRCLLNLETEVIADTEVDDGWVEWESYLKSILLASANREILSYPENYLESPFRDDKTPFFKDFENQLLQNPVTKDTAEQAIMQYLDNLDVVAHLHVLTCYHQKEGISGTATAIDILHIFARTRSVPFRYFYAKRLNDSTWTPWEKLNVDISGEHLIPVVWNRRLHLFWGLFTVRQPSQDSIKMPKPNESIPASPTYVDVQLAWSELRAGNWTPKQITDKVAVLWKSDANPDMAQDFNNWYTFRFSIDKNDNSLTISCVTATYKPAKLGYFKFLDLKGIVAVTTVTRGGRHHRASPIRIPRGTREYAMTFKGYQKQVWFPDGSADRNVLMTNPGDEYTLVFDPQYTDPSVDPVFIYQHDQRTYFVQRQNRFIWFNPRDYLSVPNLVHPGLLEGGLLGRYVAPSPSPIISQTLPNPSVVGSSRFLASGPFEGEPPPALDDVGEVVKFPGLSLRKSSSRFLGGEIDAGLGSLDLSHLAIPISTIRFGSSFQMSPIYHPMVTDFIQTLNRDGLDGLYQRPLQLSLKSTFSATYQPVAGYFDVSKYPVEDVDFLSGSMPSLYNWELFLYIPMMIAGQLSTNQKFRDAQRWYHYIFNPTDTSSLSPPNRFWQMGLFFNTSKDTYANETLPKIMEYLAKRGSNVQLTSEENKIAAALEKDVYEWRKNPFNPFLVARSRTVATQKWVVMKYLDNLIAWGDQLFRQDSIEAINEATQLYILAAEILGERPATIPPRVTPAIQTFNSISGSLNELSNPLVPIEEMVSAVNTQKLTHIYPGHRPSPAPPTMLYFCVPNNPKLLGYWDTVADRLFKIRNCMNLQGIVRELALFQPPLDPAMLVRAAASGVDLSSAMSDMNVPLSQYRYPTLAAKATELVAHVKELGRNFLDALEKRDQNAMSLLQTQNDLDLLDKVTAVKESAVDDAKYGYEILDKGLAIATAKKDYFTDRDLMNTWEELHMVLELASTVMDLAESGAQPVSAVMHLIPDAKLGAPTSIGITLGGPGLANSASKFGTFMGKLGGLIKHASSMAASMGSFNQRKDEWDHQADIAAKEIAQINVQKDAANLRWEIAKKELANHKTQIENMKKVNDLMHNKFSNIELYEWMISQLASAYFQGYQMAYDAAKRAERAFMQEVGVENPNYIRFGAWDSLKKGLLAGDQLHQDLLRLESAYLEQNKREYEITQNISLAQIDPLALMQLRSSGECFFKFSEACFDISYPGHYMRRLKTVGVTMPSIVGPYTSVSATLSLLKSSTRISALAKDKYTRRDNDTRFRDNYEQFDSICTSTGINDHGLFDISLRDDRYLPFEYAGAISSWRLTLPKKFRQFDYDTITDVIFQVRYTAREGGEVLKAIVETELSQRTLDAVQMAEGQTGMGRLFQLRRDFPDDFYRLTRPSRQDAPQEMTLKLTLQHLPYMFVAAKGITATKAAIFVRVRDEYVDDVTVDKLLVSLRPKGTDRGDGLTLPLWNGLRRGSADIKRAWGELTLTVWLAGEQKLPQDALEDVLIVVYYSAKW